MSIDDLVGSARDGDPRAVARLISRIEDPAAEAVLRETMRALTAFAGKAKVVGLTGSPGVGKSTLTSELVSAYRAQGLRVSVLAVDPSSPFSGGALLGDRVRMQDHASDRDVYIRSMATRGHLGGIAVATPQAVRVLDAAGFDVVLVETVGVGQSEVEVAALADTTVVVLAPGWGDGIQTAKAGILEVADVFVVNKADRDGADQLVNDVRNTVRLVERAPGDWRQPIAATVAVRGEGTDEVVEAIAKHDAWLAETGERERRQRRRVRDEIENLALATLREGFSEIHGDSKLDTLAEKVRVGDLDPYAAADDLVLAWRNRQHGEGVTR